MKLHADASSTIEVTDRELQLLSDLVSQEIEGRAEHEMATEPEIESLAEKLAGVSGSN